METEGACHLVKISENFGLAVNGKRFVGSSQWKIPGKKRKSKKVGPFSLLEFSERNFVFHLHVPRSLYQSQVHGKKICHGQSLANQNGFPRAHVAPQWRHFYTTSACPGLGLIGKYLVMSRTAIFIQRFVFTE